MTEAQQIIENAKEAWRKGEITTEQLLDVWRLAEYTEEHHDLPPL